MDIKSRLLDAQAIDRALMRMSHEIIEKNQDEKEICLFGILRRGVPLAKQIAENIAKISDVRVNTGALDISFYRDDLTKVDEAPRLNGTSADFTVQDKTVVLVDDVLYTGRTARAAMEAVLALGRPKRIQLAAILWAKTCRPRRKSLSLSVFPNSTESRKSLLLITIKDKNI